MVVRVELAHEVQQKRETCHLEDIPVPERCVVIASQVVAVDEVSKAQFELCTASDTVTYTCL